MLRLQGEVPIFATSCRKRKSPLGRLRLIVIPSLWVICDFTADARVGGVESIKHATAVPRSVTVK